MNELINDKYYWVRVTNNSPWEIGRFEKKEKIKGVFFFTNSTFSYVKDCFEIDYTPTERKKDGKDNDHE